MATRGVAPAALGAVLAAGEYVLDVLPSTPSRTGRLGLVARIASGGLCGWFVFRTAAVPFGLAGAGLGIVGALAGAYGGHALRLRAAARVGNVCSGLIEDAIAIGVAAFLVLT